MDSEYKAWTIVGSVLAVALLASLTTCGVKFSNEGVRRAEIQAETARACIAKGHTYNGSDCFPR